MKIKFLFPISVFPATAGSKCALILSSKNVYWNIFLVDPVVDSEDVEHIETVPAVLSRMRARESAL